MCVIVVGGGGLSWVTGPTVMCVSVRQPPIGQVGDGLVGQVGESVVDDSESVGVVLPESPGDDVVAHVESERPPPWAVLRLRPMTSPVSSTQ